MENKIIEQVALQEGFTKTALISTEDLVFEHSFRMFCEQNVCGNYGKNYACPPYCGTPQEMEGKAMKYQQAIVFQSRTSVDNIFDEDETKKIKKMHTTMTFQVAEKLWEKGLDREGTFIMPGSCSLCDTCAMPEGKPCPREWGRYSCLSAYGIHATKLAEHCEMDMEWNGDMASFFSLYLFDRI